MAMALLILHILLCIITAAGQSSAVECSPAKAVALPIKDVLVDPSIADSFMRGIPARIGSPPQPIVLLPWPELNNTWIYDGHAGCDPVLGLSETTCRVRRGAYFSSDTSQSFKKTNDVVIAGGSANEITTLGTEVDVGRLVSTSLGGTDVFAVGDDGDNSQQAVVNSMPLGVPRLNWDHGYTTLHTLGLGSDSVYLNALVKAGKIPSRVWSLFWGRTAGPNQIDGSIVLGGYDREKVVGQNYTQRLDYSEATGCWTGMKITVSGIEANFVNGANKNIIDKDQPLSVCLVPQRQHLLEAPLSVQSAFLAATSMKATNLSSGLQWTDLLIDEGTTPFDGDITFIIASTLRIRIPNNQYIIPDATFDASGRRLDGPDRKKVVAISSTAKNPNTQMGNNPYTLGRWFFTGAVLLVNHDAGTFTLWQANPSTKRDLVSVLGPKGAAGCASSVSGSGNGTNGNASTATTTNSPSTAAVVGGAVGGVIGLIVVLAAAFLVVRHRKRMSAAAKVVPGAATTGGAGPGGGGSGWTYGSESQPLYYKGGHGHGHSHGQSQGGHEQELRAPGTASSALSTQPFNMPAYGHGPGVLPPSELPSVSPRHEMPAVGGGAVYEMDGGVTAR